MFYLNEIKQSIKFEEKICNYFKRIVDVGEIITDFTNTPKLLDKIDFYTRLHFYIAFDARYFNFKHTNKPKRSFCSCASTKEEIDFCLDQIREMKCTNPIGLSVSFYINKFIEKGKIIGFSEKNEIVHTIQFKDNDNIEFIQYNLNDFLSKFIDKFNGDKKIKEFEKLMQETEVKLNNI